jgi:hypothetical protein
MMKIDDATANPSIARNLIAALEVGNYAGVPEAPWNPPGSTSKHVACKVYGTAGTGSNPWSGSGTFHASLKNTWSDALSLPITPGRGCQPQMPRYYVGLEGGTDHHTGLMLVRSMIKSQRVYSPSSGWSTAIDPLAYRAVVMLTDGEPVATSVPGTTRAAHISGTGNTSAAAVPTATSWTWKDTSYPETWMATASIGDGLREYRRDTAHSVTNIRNDTVSLAANMQSSDSTNIWTVSFRDDNTFLRNASVGDGWYSYVPTGSVSTLVDSFEEIARSLPTAIVK